MFVLYWLKDGVSGGGGGLKFKCILFGFIFVRIYQVLRGGESGEAEKQIVLEVIITTFHPRHGFGYSSILFHHHHRSHLRRKNKNLCVFGKEVEIGGNLLCFPHSPHLCFLYPRSACSSPMIRPRRHCLAGTVRRRAYSQPNLVHWIRWRLLEAEQDRSGKSMTDEVDLLR